jgi:hypothetical protein
MADRISWGNFPDLRDFDRFTVRERAGTPGHLEVSLAKDARVTWWKAVKVLERGTGRIVTEQTLEGSDNGPRSLSIAEPEMDRVKLVLAKAKIFGIHTDLYEIYELREKLGRRVELVWLTDGPANVWEAIGSFFSDLVTPIARAVITVVRAIIGVILRVLGVILDALAFLANAVFAIPAVGRFISAVVHYINYAVNFIVNTLLEVVFGFLGAFGVRAPNKYLRLAVVIQRDEAGNPVATPDQIAPQIAFLQELYQVRANVLVVPYRPWDTPIAAAFGAEPAPARDFIVEEKETSAAATLDVRCREDGVRDDFGIAGSTFQWKMTRLFWGGTGRALGLGGALVAFAVRGFVVPAGAAPRTVGCSNGPGVDYVTIDFANSLPSTLAHEVGHACALMHSDAPPAPFNLMQAGRTNPSPPGDLSTWLTDAQAYLIRSSVRTSFV